MAFYASSSFSQLIRIASSSLSLSMFVICYLPPHGLTSTRMSFQSCWLLISSFTSINVLKCEHPFAGFVSHIARACEKVPADLQTQSQKPEASCWCNPLRFCSEYVRPHHHRLVFCFIILVTHNIDQGFLNLTNDGKYDRDGDMVATMILFVAIKGIAAIELSSTGWLDGHQRVVPPLSCRQRVGANWYTSLTTSLSVTWHIVSRYDRFTSIRDPLNRCLGQYKKAFSIRSI